MSCGSSVASDIAGVSSLPAPPESWPTESARSVAYGTIKGEKEKVKATVYGEIPSWLRGALVRNGPGNYDGMQHLFDGYSLLTKLDINGASKEVFGSHRFLQSTAYQYFKKTGGKMKWREVGTPRPHNNLLEMFADISQTMLGVMGLGDGVTDNASVNIIPQPNGQVLAVTETVFGTFGIDVSSLDTVERKQFRDKLKGDITTAHPSILPNGDLVNFVTNVKMSSMSNTGFTLFRQPAGDPFNREVLAQIPSRRVMAPSWVHDFPSSINSIVIPEMPLYFNLWLLLSGGSNENMFMDWKPQDGSLIHVVSLSDNQVKSFRAPSFFVFHWVNAYESDDGRYLYIDGAVYDDPAVIQDLYLDPVRASFENGKDISQSYYRRLTVDMHAPSDSEIASGWERLIDDESAYGRFFEFPCVSPAHHGRPYRYAYGACATRPTNAANSLVKMDNQERSSKVWHEPGVLVGEPIFVPQPDGQCEDDGAVLSIITQADGHSALLVLNGRSFEEIARAVLPYGLPNGFHGCFIPS